MITIRVERRNREGRVTLMMEKDFPYHYGMTLARWVKEELNGAVSVGDTLTIKRIDEQ